MTLKFTLSLGAGVLALGLATAQAQEPLRIGVVSVLFAHLSDHAQVFFRRVFDAPGLWQWMPLLVTPLAYAVLAFLADRFFPGSQGSGIPQAIAARHLHDDPQRELA